MLTIGQVASQTGLRASAIRYYEAQGLLPAPLRRSGKRVYSTSILERVAVIELAKLAGFGLNDIRTLVSNVEAGKASPAWKQLVPARTAEIDAQMKQLAGMKDILARLNTCACSTLEECGRAFIEARSQRPHGAMGPEEAAKAGGKS
jgi:MerR family transcriptional regulator, redox-sensitive transcriptional activator SoxR